MRVVPQRIHGTLCKHTSHMQSCEKRRLTLVPVTGPLAKPEDLEGEGD